PAFVLVVGRGDQGGIAERAQGWARLPGAGGGGLPPGFLIVSGADVSGPALDDGARPSAIDGSADRFVGGRSSGEADRHGIRLRARDEICTRTRIWCRTFRKDVTYVRKA